MINHHLEQLLLADVTRKTLDQTDRILIVCLHNVAFDELKDAQC